jgi:hypothetical protein
MADTSTEQVYQVIVGGKPYEYATCTECANEDYVFHIGYSDGRIGSDVWMCTTCVQNHKHTEHYERTGYTPEFFPKLKTQTKSTQAEEKPVKNAKKGTTNTGKSKKATKAVQTSAPVTTESVLSATFLGDGSSPNYRRFKLQQKGAEVAGSVYITPDLVPEGCTDIVVTVTFKEN